MKKAVAHWDEERDRRRVEQVRPIPFVPEELVDRDPDERILFRLLLMRESQTKYPDSKSLVTLYEKTGNPMYYLAMVHMILDKIVLCYGLTHLIPRPQN